MTERTTGTIFIDMSNRLHDDWMERIKDFLHKPSKGVPDPLGLLEDPIQKALAIIDEIEEAAKRRGETL